MTKDMKTIEFNEIGTIPSTKKEIFEYGNTDVSLFLEYFSLRYERFRDRFIVESRFLWQMYQKQSKIRILLVKMADGDIVYCYIKNVTIYPAIYLILMGKPLSKSNNKDNEDRVLSELGEYSHVKGFEGIQEEIDSVSKDLFILNPSYYEEYYIDTKEQFDSHLNKSSWRSKYSINKIKLDGDFEFREFERRDYEKNQKLVNLWKESNKAENKVKFETKSYMDILNSVYQNSLPETYLIYNLFFKGELIGCLMFLTIRINDEISIAYQEHNINLSKFLEKNNELNIGSGFYKNIGNIMFYLTTEDLIKKGIKFSYCQGVKFWNKKESGNYKRRLNNKRIEFYKVFFKK
jgi:hypothetical protein